MTKANILTVERIEIDPKDGGTKVWLSNGDELGNITRVDGSTSVNAATTARLDVIITPSKATKKPSSKPETGDTE